MTKRSQAPQLDHKSATFSALASRGHGFNKTYGHVTCPKHAPPPPRWETFCWVRGVPKRWQCFRISALWYSGALVAITTHDLDVMMSHESGKLTPDEILNHPFGSAAQIIQSGFCTWTIWGLLICRTSGDEHHSSLSSVQSNEFNWACWCVYSTDSRSEYAGIWTKEMK